MKKLVIERFAVVSLKEGHRIYAVSIQGQLYFYDPITKKWIPNESMDIGTQDDYKRAREKKFSKVKDDEN